MKMKIESREKTDFIYQIIYKTEYNSVNESLGVRAQYLLFGMQGVSQTVYKTHYISPIFLHFILSFCASQKSACSCGIN